MANEYYREVTLPSRGVPYAGALGDGSVTVSPWSTETEKQLAGGHGVRSLLDLIITRHTKPTGMDRWPIRVGDLLVVDRIFLLFQARMATYPSIPYGFRVQCEGCGKGVDMEVNLEDREVIYLDAGYEKALLVEVGDADVQLRLLTGTDEDDIAKTAKRRVRAARRRDKGTDDEEYVLTLARHIAAIDDQEVNLGEALEFIMGLHGGDLLEIKDALEALRFGLDGEVVAECGRCGFDSHTTMPFGDEFFRPRGRRTRRGDSAGGGRRPRPDRSDGVRRRDGDGSSRAPVVAGEAPRARPADAMDVRSGRGASDGPEEGEGRPQVTRPGRTFSGA